MDDNHVIKEVETDTAKVSITASPHKSPLKRIPNIGEFPLANKAVLITSRILLLPEKLKSKFIESRCSDTLPDNVNYVNQSAEIVRCESPTSRICEQFNNAIGITDESESVYQNASKTSGSSKSWPSPSQLENGCGSSKGSFTDSTNNDDDAEVTNAELGLAEDHFSQPDGHFCLSRSEELEMAIENCKEMILESTEISEKRKNLVKKLIQLRMKLQEVKDGSDNVPPDMKVVLGHHFVKKQIERPKHYCEKCTGIIWGVLQTWHQCTDCSFSCHGKCLHYITRTCARVKALDDPNYIYKICPEVGLSAQNYRCAECRSHIMFKNSWVEPRLCDYNGHYYCPNCHWNSLAVMPARVLHNWDFEHRKVCRASKQFLRLMMKKAVLRVQDINPMLFSFVEELSLVKKLREEILVMKKYFLACREALHNKMLLLLADRQHFVDNADMYSMQDLIDVHSGVLLSYLTQIHAQFSKHIKDECQICRGQGFICELCDVDEILFPFDNIAAVCANCSWVFHMECFRRKEQQCPRCIRRQERSNNTSVS